MDRAINGSGIRDISRVLKMSKNTVIATLKKADNVVVLHPKFQACNPESAPTIRLDQACDEAELDEQWSYVGNKSNQRWLGYAVDHATNTILAFVFGKRKESVFQQLKFMLKSFGI